MTGEVTDELNLSGAIRVELGTALQVEFEGVPGRTPGTLIGIDPKRYLVIKLGGPREPIVSKLFKGSSLVVRYLFDGSVFGFQSLSLGSVTVPDRLLFAAYPSIVAEQTLRCARRLRCALPATLTMAGGEHPALVLDLTALGAQLSFPSPAGEAQEEALLPAVDAEVELETALPGDTQALALKGAVRNATSADGACVLGVLFESLSEDDRGRVEAYLERLRQASPD